MERARKRVSYATLSISSLPSHPALVGAGRGCRGEDFRARNGGVLPPGADQQHRRPFGRRAERDTRVGPPARQPFQRGEGSRAAGSSHGHGSRARRLRVEHRHAHSVQHGSRVGRRGAAQWLAARADRDGQQAVAGRFPLSVFCFLLGVPGSPPLLPVLPPSAEEKYWEHENEKQREALRRRRCRRWDRCRRGCVLPREAPEGS